MKKCFGQIILLSSFKRQIIFCHTYFWVNELKGEVWLLFIHILSVYLQNTKDGFEYSIRGGGGGFRHKTLLDTCTYRLVSVSLKLRMDAVGPNYKTSALARGKKWRRLLWKWGIEGA